MTMDYEKRAYYRNIRVIVSEIIMVLVVIVTVVILAFVVSGYWLNSDFKLERQGMLQISSIPTGADVAVDGESAWNQRTNTSKVLSSGKHDISVTKEGYDSWSRSINIREGLLYRIHYPRLFLQNREKNPVLDVSNATYATVSPNREHMLLANNTTEWELVNLTHDSLEKKPIDIAGHFSGTSLASGASKGLFIGSIVSASWSTNNEKVLIESSYNGTSEWVVLDIKNPTTSLNLTRLFNMNFSRISIMDDSAAHLIALANGNLHTIDLGARQISAILAQNVVDYDHYNSEIIFSAKKEEKYYIGIIKNQDEPQKEIFKYDTPASVAILRFYDDIYVSIAVDGKNVVYKKDDFSEYFSGEISIIPETYNVGHAGEFVIASSGQNIVTVDMEAMEVVEWSIDSAHYGWLDPDMLYAVNDGELVVRDYDGLNRRSLAKNVSSHFPVVITGDKWLYYFSDGDLIREVIRN